jgi:hypothetical protein
MEIGLDANRFFRRSSASRAGPLEIDLIHRTLASGGVDTEHLVLQYGRSFNGIPRPKGYRHQRAQKKCFANSQILDFEDRGNYCKGLLIAPSGGSAVRHGCITLDGTGAIDVTLRNAHEIKYFGIAFGEQTPLMMKIVLERGFWSPLLSPPIDLRVIDALKMLRADGLI